MDDINVNLYMLETGNAWWYKRYAKNEYKFKAAVKKAQREKLGLWEDEDPTPPWEFRRKNRK